MYGYGLSFALLWAIGISAAGMAAERGERSGAIERIRRAGNTENEQERYRLLAELAHQEGVDGELRADLEKLLPTIDEWANGRNRAGNDPSRAAENGYLCRFITNRVKPKSEGDVYPPAPRQGSPLEPIWAFYRGRMLIWRVIQSGPLLRVAESRDAYFGEARQLLRLAQQAFPENRVIGMYLDQPIPWPKSFESDAGAPAWAELQRENLEKLADIIHWWIDERQLPDGQFGGGWGDDVEMWRWWTPLLIGFDDPKINAAQERISRGIFEQPHLAAGFTKRMTDVEHANEDTTDTILPMMHLVPDDAIWSNRAVRLAELMEEKWTGRNERGFLQFMSIYFSVDRVDDNPERAFDTVYHPSIVQPTLLYWQRTKDPRLTRLFGEWLKVWVDASARAENGKPAGVLPSTIHWPDGKVAMADRPWWEVFSPGHNDALYNWPGATRLMTSTLLVAYQVTGDEYYLGPLHSMAAICRKYAGRSTRGEPGSEAWCAGQIDGFLPDTLAKYRFLTGDRQFDDLIENEASGYARYRLTGELKPLLEGLKRNAVAFRSNWEGYTSEMRWTDRVMNFTSNYLEKVSDDSPPSPRAETLYQSVTGDPGTALVMPLNAVRWLTRPREIAALVTDSNQERFEARLYHFGGKARAMGAELYLLKSGRYQWTLAEDGSPKAIQRGELVVGTGPARLAFELAPRRPCVLKVTPLSTSGER